MSNKIYKKYSYFLFFTLFVFLSCPHGYSQITFTKIFGAGTTGKYISQNSDGSFIVALDSNGIYNASLDAYGNVQWVNNIISGNSSSSSIEEDPNGGYIFCGTTEDTSQFLSVATVIKLDLNGDSIWQKTFPPGDNGSSGRLILSAKDSLYAFAYYEDGALHTNHGYILKLDTNGNAIWTNGTGNTSVSTSGLIQDDDTNFVYTSSDGTSASYFSFGKFTNTGGLAGFNTMGDDTISPCYCLENSTCISQTLDNGYLVGAIISSKPILIKLNNQLDTLWTKNYNHFVSPTSCLQDNDSGFMILASDYYLYANEFALLHVNKDGDSLDSHSFNVLSSCSVTKMKKCADGGFTIIGTAIDSSTMLTHAFVIKTDALGRVLQNLSGNGSTLDWASINPSPCFGYSAGKFVLSDDSCNVYVAGYCPDTIYGTILTIKYNVNGDTVWTRRNENSPQGMKLDKDGNIIVIGITSINQGIVLKYNPSGSLLDSAIIDSVYTPTCFDFDQQGNIIIVGYKIIQGFAAEKIIKYDSMLNLLWESVNPSFVSGDQLPKAMKLINDSTICIISTSYSGSQQTANSTLLTEIYQLGLGILDTATYGNYFGFAVDLRLLNSGGIYVSGKVDTFNTVLLRYDSNLNLVWGFQLNDSYSDDLSIDNDIYENIYITSSLVNNGVLLHKYDSSGSLQWSTSSAIFFKPIVIASKDSVPSVYVCGPGSIFESTGTNLGTNFSVFKYDFNNGQLMNEYPAGYYYDYGNGHFYSEVEDATVDRNSNVYLTGFADDGNNRVHQTIKFSTQNYNGSLYVFGGDSLSVDPAEYYQWYKDGQPIGGAIQEGINCIQTGNGTYHCEVIKGCKSFISDSIMITSVGLGKINENNSFIFYPNPTHDRINFSAINNERNFNVEIINSLGDVVIREINENEINISGLARGIYFIKIIGSKNINSGTFLKQ